MRANFSQAVCRVLANRVGLHCSNPDCRAYTAGPKRKPEAALNVGVAAHITAASKGGPRYAPNLSDKQRSSATNGIWLCQTCAKLIDDDEARFAVAVLEKWKHNAEEEALKRIGKTNVRNYRSAKIDEQNLKRDHRVRDELSRAFLKDTRELLAESPGRAQYRKFRETEFIVHRLGDRLYPEFDPAPGISNWFKLEVFDLYFNGIEGILNIEHALATEFTKSWSLLPDARKEEALPKGFWPIKVFKTGRIPWRNIRHYDPRGDEYYPFPHLYCLYADDGMPYESFEYYQISEDGSHHFRLPSEWRVELEKLLSLDASKQNPWEPLV